MRKNSFPAQNDAKGVNKVKKALSCFVALLMLASSVAALAEAVPDNGHVSLVTDPETIAFLDEGRKLMEVTSAEVKTVPLYFAEPEPMQDQDLTFFNGNNYVAYLDMDTCVTMFNELFEHYYPGISPYKMEYIGGDGPKTCVITHPSGAEALVDFVDGVIYFSDLDKFKNAPTKISGGDVVSFQPYQQDRYGSILRDSDGTPLIYLIQRSENDYGNFTKSGYAILLPLAPMEDIPIYWYEDKGYIPMTTFCDLFWQPLGITMVYLEGKLFMLPRNGAGKPIEGEKTLYDVFISAASGERPEELITYNYNELVMLLDLHYGLKEEHGITEGFDSFFVQTGLAEKLLSPDAKVYSDAMGELVTGYFGDLHSSFESGGPYAGADYAYNSTQGNLVTSFSHSDMNMERFAFARSATSCVDEYGRPIPYMEVGDTAYITFDHFESIDSLEYYDPETQMSFPDYCGRDQVALVHYAHTRINREGSPIKNVVIDLSNNSGGDADMAAFIGSWVLGSFEMNTINATTEAQFTVSYMADVDLDGRITRDDFLDLNRLNVYCLICENSFSCGNLLPAAFKQSGLVTLLGQTSGGGACVVIPIMTPDGTVINISSMSKICMMKNGIFYSVDRGVDPDVSIRQISHFYDREWLTEFIHQIP